jgi:nucleotide-binding universal stress UspA family protein
LLIFKYDKGNVLPKWKIAPGYPLPNQPKAYSQIRRDGMFDKILVTMGLSTPIWSAIPYVRHLALKFGSELHILGISTEPQQVWDRSLMSYVESISSSLQEENITTKTDFIYGNPAVEVVKYSNKHGISLVATTTGSCNEITYAILNNIAKRMHIKMNIPVLMVPPGRSKEPNLAVKVTFLKILVPLDCTPVGEAALPYVESIAGKVESSVILLHVNAPPLRGVPVMHREVLEISKNAGLNYLKKVNKNVREQGIKSDYEVIEGTPAKTILKYASLHKIDLIAMGTRGASGMQGWIFGSTTNKVSEKTAIPVLAVGYVGIKR